MWFLFGVGCVYLFIKLTTKIEGVESLAGKKEDGVKKSPFRFTSRGFVLKSDVSKTFYK